MPQKRGIRLELKPPKKELHDLIPNKNTLRITYLPWKPAGSFSWVLSLHVIPSPFSHPVFPSFYIIKNLNMFPIFHYYTMNFSVCSLYCFLILCPFLPLIFQQCPLIVSRLLFDFFHNFSNLPPILFPLFLTLPNFFPHVSNMFPYFFPIFSTFFHILPYVSLFFPPLPPFGLLLATRGTTPGYSPQASRPVKRRGDRTLWTKSLVLLGLLVFGVVFVFELFFLFF